MKIKIATTCLLMSAMLVPMAGFADDADADRSNPVAFVKDSTITTKIKAELAADSLTSLTHISVDTDSNGEVWLSGTNGRRLSVVPLTGGLVEFKIEVARVFLKRSGAPS